MSLEKHLVLFSTLVCTLGKIPGLERLYDNYAILRVLPREGKKKTHTQTNKNNNNNNEVVFFFSIDILDSLPFKPSYMYNTDVIGKRTNHGKVQRTR